MRPKNIRIIFLLLIVSIQSFADSAETGPIATSANDEFITIFLRGYVRGNDHNVLGIYVDTPPAGMSFYDNGDVPFSSPDILRSSAKGWRNIYQYWLMSASQGNYYNPINKQSTPITYMSDIYMREIGDFTEGWAPNSPDVGPRAAGFSSGPDANMMIRRQPLLGLAKTQWVYEKVNADFIKENSTLAGILLPATINRLLLFGPKFYDMLVANGSDNYDLVEIGRGGVFQVVHE